MLAPHGTSWHTFDALPSGNGRLSGKNYWLPLREAFVPRRGPVDSYFTGQRVAFHAVAVVRLSSTRTRCNCSRHVFVPRDDCVLRCVQYTFVVRSCQAKMNITKQSHLLIFLKKVKLGVSPCPKGRQLGVHMV
jgi:hypothetical protein